MPCDPVSLSHQSVPDNASRSGESSHVEVLALWSDDGHVVIGICVSEHLRFMSLSVCPPATPLVQSWCFSFTPKASFYLACCTALPAHCQPATNVLTVSVDFILLLLNRNLCSFCLASCFQHYFCNSYVSVIFLNKINE